MLPSDQTNTEPAGTPSQDNDTADGAASAVERLAIGVMVGAVANDVGCRPTWRIVRRSTWLGILVDEQIWLRYSPESAKLDLAHAELAAARASGPAVARPVRDRVYVSGGIGTLWEYIQSVTPATPSHLATALSVLHRQPAVGASADHRDNVISAADRSFAGGFLTSAEHDQLCERADRAARTLEQDPGPAGVGVTHNDAHLGNVVAGAHGPVLIDLETVGVGPVICDFAPLHVEAVRYAQPDAAFAELCDTYEAITGTRPATHGAPFQAAVALYEMWAALWAVEAALRDPAVDTEARRRIDTLCHAQQHIWTRV